MEQLFFQSSLPRAGSTLLQNILGQNPDFYVTPTSGALSLLQASRQIYTHDHGFKAQDEESMRRAFLYFCNGGLNGYFTALTDKKYVVDKSRGWGVQYNFIDSFYPDPKIVCMVRDLRSVYASMERNYRKYPEKDIGLIDRNELKGTTTRKRVDHWAVCPPVGAAIEGIEQMITEGIDKKVLFIRFEDLTTDPQVELDKIYDFFGLESYEHDFKNVKQLTQ